LLLAIETGMELLVAVSMLLLSIGLATAAAVATLCLAFFLMTGVIREPGAGADTRQRVAAG
jgi:hypothetical protein